ncbi:hypothetical protein [Paractinoplanes ferrugineus]|uniref:hypothetical protein n=1 Tax=Paractinoplanes ferrugineus TaxID=113564 RepID=UPI0019438904|nr:hypothetical protein [Actinoplanes ferrugineus]
MGAAGAGAAEGWVAGWDWAAEEGGAAEGDWAAEEGWAPPYTLPGVCCCGCDPLAAAGSSSESWGCELP